MGLGRSIHWCCTHGPDRTKSGIDLMHFRKGRGCAVGERYCSLVPVPPNALKNCHIIDRLRHREGAAGHTGNAEVLLAEGHRAHGNSQPARRGRFTYPRATCALACGPSLCRLAL